MRHRGVEREDRQASDGRVLPRQSGEHHDVPCAKTAGQHAGGADDAFPDDGRLERRVLLGVGRAFLADSAVQHADREGGRSGAFGARDSAGMCEERAVCAA